MAKFGSKLDQGNEHEAAFGKARMRNLHSGLVNGRSFIEQNIEIDNPGASRDRFPAAKLAFDRLQLIQQCARDERSFRFDDAIQKPGLRKKIDWLRLIGGGAAQNSHGDFR